MPSPTAPTFDTQQTTQKTQTRLPDLDNDVLPALAASKFKPMMPGTDIQADYELIRPSLQLVTLVMRHLTPDFWFALKHGNVVPNADGGPATLWRARTTVNLTRNDRDQVASLLDDLTDCVVGIWFAVPTNNASWNGATRSWTRGDGKRVCFIRMNKTLLENLRSAESTRNRIQALFSLSRTLLHEFAHAMAHMTGMSEEQEPFFENDQIAELGQAFEHFLFGGLMIGRWPEESDQLAMMSWPFSTRVWSAMSHSLAPVTRRGQLPNEDCTSCVNDADIQKLFKKAFWGKAIANGDERISLAFTEGVMYDGKTHDHSFRHMPTNRAYASR